MKRLSVILIILFSLVAAGYIVATNLPEKNTNNTASTPERLDDVTPVDKVEQVSTENKIEIKDFNYNPAELTIKVGTKVTWTNSDGAAHTVTSDNDGPLDSELLSTGDSYSFTFNEKGSYAYFCKPHPNMRARIVVTE